MYDSTGFQSKSKTYLVVFFLTVSFFFFNIYIDFILITYLFKNKKKF